MKQRVMIAMALAKNPALLIADEPTTALDVTVQQGILKFLLHLKELRKLSILFITHDLRIAFALADRVLVMKDGEIVEEVADPRSRTVRHAYSQRLLNAASAGKNPKQYLEI